MSDKPKIYPGTLNLSRAKAEMHVLECTVWVGNWLDQPTLQTTFGNDVIERSLNLDSPSADGMKRTLFFASKTTADTMANLKDEQAIEYFKKLLSDRRSDIKEILSDNPVRRTVRKTPEIEDYAPTLDSIIDRHKLPYSIDPPKTATFLRQRTVFVNTIEGDALYRWDAEKGHLVEYGEQFIRSALDGLVHEYLTNHDVEETIHSIKNGTMESVSNLHGAECLSGGHVLINIPSGVLDLETLTVKDHDPSYRFTGRLPIDFRPEAKPDAILDFLMDICFPNFEMFFNLQEHAAYTFVDGYPIQKGILYQGTGGNGKGVWMHILRRLWDAEGENTNVASLPLQDMHDRFKTACLYGKALNLAGDLSDDDLKDTGTFKKATGGDPITAEHKNKPPFQFDNRAKLFNSCNKISKTADETRGFYQRWSIEQFLNTFRGTDSEITDLGKLLATPDNLSGFFNVLAKWFIPIVRKRTRFTFDKDEDTIKEIYTRFSDSAQAFILERIEFDQTKGVETETNELLSCYYKFCTDKHLIAESDKDFWVSLKNKMQDKGLPYDDRRQTKDGVSHHYKQFVRIRAQESLIETDEQPKNNETDTFEKALARYVELNQNYGNIPANEDRRHLQGLQGLQAFYTIWFVGYSNKESSKKMGVMGAIPTNIDALSLASKEAESPSLARPEPPTGQAGAGKDLKQEGICEDCSTFKHLFEYDGDYVCADCLNVRQHKNDVIE